VVAAADCGAAGELGGVRFALCVAAGAVVVDDVALAVAAVVVVSAARASAVGDAGGVRFADGVKDEGADCALADWVSADLASVVEAVSSDLAAVVFDAESAVVVDAESAVVVDAVDVVLADADDLLSESDALAFTPLASSANWPFSSMRPTFAPRSAAASELPASFIARTGV